MSKNSTSKRRSLYLISPLPAGLICALIADFTSAAALKKIADAADPLYKTLDDGQKRRLAILTHRGGRFGGEGWRQRGMDRGGDGDGDHGFDRGQGRDHGGRGGPERL